MANLYLKKTILEVVDNQLAMNNPPFTKETFEKLLRIGYSKQQAKEAIADVLLTEIVEVLKSQKPYNENRYRKNLENMLKQASKQRPTKKRANEVKGE